MKYDFDQIKSLHEQSKASGGLLGQMSLGDFATTMQQSDPDNDWSAGHSPDNFAGSMSRGIGSAIDATGLPDLTASAGGGIGSLVDSGVGRQDQHYQKLGENIGHGIPRSAADLGLTVGGMAMLATPAAPLGYGMVAAGTVDAGLTGYEQTGSVGQGLLAGGMNIAAPGIGRIGGAAGIKLLPKALQYSGGARVAADLAGSELAFAGIQAAEQGLRGENPFTADNLFANALGLAAFAPLNVVGGARVYKETPTRPFGGDLTMRSFGATDTSAFAPTESSITNLNLKPKAVKKEFVTDQEQLTKYLFGEQDSSLPETFKNQGLDQVLKDTGLDPTGLSTQEKITEIGARRRAKDMIKGMEVETPEQPTSAKVEFFKSEEEAQAALATYPEGSTITKTGGETVPGVGPGGGRLKATQTSNAQWRVKAPEPAPVAEPDWMSLSSEAANLLRVPTESLVDTIKIVQMANKLQKAAGNTIADPEWTPTVDGVKAPVVKDAGAGMEVSVDSAGNPTVGKVRKPKAVKRKAGFVEAEQFDLPLSDTDGGIKASAEASRPIENPVKASAMPSGRDNITGTFTTKSMQQELLRLWDTEWSPEQAQVRLTQKVRNFVESKSNPNPEHLPAMKVISEALDNTGVSPELKAEHMAAAQRILDIAHQPGVRYLSQRGSEAAGIRPMKADEGGLYWPSDHLVQVAAGPNWSKETPIGPFHILQILAHEVTHSMFGAIKRNVNWGIDDFRIKHAGAAWDYVNSLDANQRSEMMKNLYNRLVPKVLRENDDVLSIIRNKYEYASSTGKYEYNQAKPEVMVDEFLTDYASLILMSKASTSEKQSVIRNMTEQLRDFTRSVFRSVHELSQAVFMGLSARNKELMASGQEIDIAQVKEFHKNIEALYSKDPAEVAMKQQVSGAVKAMAAIERGDIGGASVKFAPTPEMPKASAQVAQELTKLKEGNGFTRIVIQHQQMANGMYYRENLPAYSQLVSHLTTQDGLAVTLHHGFVRDFLVELDGGQLKALSTVPDGKLNAQQIHQKGIIKRIESNPGLARAVYDTMLTSNELTKLAGEQGTAYPTFDSPEIQAHLSKFTPEQVSDVRHVFETYARSNRKAGDAQIKTKHMEFEMVAANYLLGSGVDFKTARPMAMELLVGLQKGTVGWAVKPDAKLGVEGVLGGLPPMLVDNPGAVAFAKHWERTKPQFDAFVQNFDRPYFTEFRSGRFGVRYEVAAPVGGWNGDPNDVTPRGGYRSTNDRFEYKAIQRDVKNDPRNTVVELMDHNNDPKGRFGQMQTAGIQEAINLVRAHFDAFVANGKPELQALFKDSTFDPAKDLVDTVKSDLKTLGPRSLAPGREKINMIEAQNAYLSLIARKAANSMTRLETDWLMKHPDWEKVPQLKEEMHRFKDGVLNGGRQQFQGFRKVTTALTMAGNVSSAIIDSTQPITMGLWRATAELGFTKALGLTVRSYAEAFGRPGKIKDKQFETILVEAINKGYLKTGGSLDAFMSSDDAINYNVLKAAANRDLVDLKTNLTSQEFLAHRVFEQFSAMSGKVFDTAMTPMRLSAQINNKSALFVGYEMGKAKNMKGEELFNYAVNHMQTVNLQGQRAAHSSFKLKAGEANGLVEAATLMTNYPIAMFGEMVSNWNGMLKSSGLDAATRHKSMQAFAGQVLTQMAFAGMTGLGLKGVFAFAKSMFGVDPEEAIREGMAAIDSSGTLGEVLLNGVANQLTGVDLSSRFDLSGVGGFNPYTGFDAKGLFGAGGGTISALYNAPQQFAKGDMSKMQLIPTGFRRMLTANGEDAYKDSSGQKLIDPTVGERFAQMIGFKPARLAQAMEQKNTMRDIEQNASQDGGIRKAKMVALMQEGKGAEVQEILKMELEEEFSDPVYNTIAPMRLQHMKKLKLQEKMREVVNYGVDKLMPFDPMTDGSGDVAEQKGQAYDSFGKQQMPRQSEVQKLMLKQQMMQKLNMPLPRNAPKAVRNAQKIDELIRQNPSMTRSQAAALIQG